MTTAHRPTWKAAVGREHEGGYATISTATSAKDAPAHTRLKVRHELLGGHQQLPAPSASLSGVANAASERKKELLAQSLLQLEQAEASARSTASLKRPPPVDPAVEEQAKLKLLKQTAEVDVDALKEKYDDADADAEDNYSKAAGGGGSDSSDLDADDDDDDDLDNDSDDSSSDSDDEEDEEAALQAELAKIRAEREQAKRKEEEAAAAEETAKQEEAALLGNPLLSSFSEVLKTNNHKRRRWNEDVVFRNQAKGEPTPKKRFINDTVRNDFHRRFLNKFIR